MKKKNNREKKKKLSDFLYVSLGNSFPYLKDNVASISVSKNQTYYVLGSALVRRAWPWGLS